MAYIETPRTDAGNATLMTGGHNLDTFSLEHSFVSPLKKKGNNELLHQVRNGRGHLNLKTPRARMPLVDRRNVPSLPARQEFTPLLHSVTKKNFERSGKAPTVPDTPAFLKGTLQENRSPALPATEPSAIYGSELGSSVIGNGGNTPIPQIASSSEQSTPLATLPGRDIAGVLNEQGNLMTLREQENIIDKVEKENFGLKLKIHFLEESLRKTGPGFHEAALKENTELKVDRVTLQRELARCKKMLSQAERDVEALKHHVEEVQERARHKQADTKIRQELHSLQEMLATKENEVEEMKKQVRVSHSSLEETEKLKTEVEDLETDLREKDRLLDERDDEIDKIKAGAERDTEDLQDELDEARKRIEEFEKQHSHAAASALELKEAKRALQESHEAKEKAEGDLEELREELANKSITTKGLNRQIEEKARRFEEGLIELRRKHAQLEESFDEKVRAYRQLEDRAQDLEQDCEIRDQRLKDQNELLQIENDSLKRKSESISHQLKAVDEDLRARTEEKDLLHSRHDALTTESKQSQKELQRAQSTLSDLERELEKERQHSVENDRRLRSEAKTEMNQLSAEIDRLRRELEDSKSRHATERDLWSSQRRGLELLKVKAEEQAAGLQRTVSKLHETEGTISDRETHLQQALESEKQRHTREEAILDGQIKDLNADLEEKRQTIEELRHGAAQTKQELQASQREQADSQEKIQSLEDEVEVLQCGLDEEAEAAREQLEVLQQEFEAMQSELQTARRSLVERQEPNTDGVENGENRILIARLQTDLSASQKEQGSLKNLLMMNSLEAQKLETKASNMEAERDELQCQIKQNKEEADNARDIIASQTRDLETLQQKNKVASRDRDCQDSISALKVQRLESRLAELENEIALNRDLDQTVGGIKTLQKELSSTRERELENLRQVLAQKDVVNGLKKHIEELERKLHDAEMARLATESAKSSDESAGRTQVAELRQQLVDNQRQLNEVQNKSKADMSFLQEQLVESELQIRKLEEKCHDLDYNLASAKQSQGSLNSQNVASAATIARLRRRISSIEQDLRTKRHHTKENIIVEERRDLHELLKDAKLESEDLQLKISNKEAALADLAARDKDLRSQLKRTREERTTQQAKSNALANELDRLQVRHERALEKLSQQRKDWNAERHELVSRVRFPHNSISELHEGNKESQKDLEVQHMSELRGLAKQIQWLKAKCQRETKFRTSLVYEKKFLLMRIGMFEACNMADLELLTEMGVNPSTNPHMSTRLRLGKVAIKDIACHIGEIKRRPSLRTVALAMIAQSRMRRGAREWSTQKKVKETLEMKLDAVRKGRGVRSSAHRV